MSVGFVELETSGEVSIPNIQSLFQEKNYGELLAFKKSPDAQLAAFITMQGLNVRADSIQRGMLNLNPQFIQNKLGLPEEISDRLRDGFEKITNAEAQLKKDKERLDSQFFWENHPDEQEKLRQKSIAMRSGIEIFAKERLFPLKEAVLVGSDIPNDYKLEVLKSLQPAQYDSSWTKDEEWNSRAVEQDKKEDELLKRLVESPETSGAVKKAALECASGRVGWDVQALAVADVEEFERLGVDLDRMFLSVAANKKVDGDFFEQEIAPRFFEDYSPRLARRCWETLRKCTDSTVDKYGSAFFGGDTDIFNRERFKEFMDHSHYLIPYIEVMQPFGFLYMPQKFEQNKYVYDPEFLESFESLPIKPQELKEDLAELEDFYPHFRYLWKTKHVSIPTERRGEYVRDINPYSICFERAVGQWVENLKKGESSQRKALSDALTLVHMAPPAWKDGIIHEYVEWATNTLGFWVHKEPAVFGQAVRSTNELMLDPAVSELTRRSVATGYFRASVDPESKNIGPLFDYLQKYPQDIGVSVEDEWRSDTDAVWHEFVMKAGDVYRYRLGGTDEREVIALMKSDLDYAQKALAQIKDHNLRDQAAEQLVYAFTDIDFRDLEVARSIAGSIQNDYLREQTEQTIALEVEREQKGETTAWKKTEKVRRVSRQNMNYLADLLGFGTPATFRHATEEFSKRTGHMNVTSKRLEPSPESVNLYAQEVARIRGEVGVTVNLDWEAVPELLADGRIQSMWDDDAVLRRRRDTVKYNYAERRDEVERKLGNRSKGGARDPHPVYGAVYSENGRDEFFGAAPRYGYSFIKIKPERIEDRTMITYDDSFNVFSGFPMTWEDATETKAMLNVLEHKTAHGYVEAQILNGVSLSDIESINITKAELQFIQFEQGSEAVAGVKRQIEAFRQSHPGIAINIIADADIDKYIELASTYTSWVDPHFIEGLKRISDSTRGINLFLG